MYPFTSAAALPLHHTFHGSIASSSANSVCSSWPFLLPILSALIDVSNLGQVLLELDKWRRGEEAKQSPLLSLTRLIGVNLLGGREGESSSSMLQGLCCGLRTNRSPSKASPCAPRDDGWRRVLFKLELEELVGTGQVRLRANSTGENGMGVKNRSSLGWRKHNFFISIT